jgi:hypothetical protein
VKCYKEAHEHKIFVVLFCAFVAQNSEIILGHSQYTDQTLPILLT